jgi:hypothetical protein
VIYIRLAAALAVLFLAGAGATAAIMPRGKLIRPLMFLGLSFVVGFGLTGLLSVTAMLIGAKTGPALVLAVGGIGLIALLWKRPTLQWDRPEGSRSRWAILPLALGGITAFALACSSDDTGWDHRAFWSLKAFSIQRYGTFLNPDFTSDVRPHIHPRYPLLVPSVHAWIYTATGTTSGLVIRLAMALFFVSSWAVVAEGLRRRASPASRPWLLTFYAWTPSLMSGTTGAAISGYTDYPLAVFILLALLKGVDWIENGDRASGILSALALVCAVQTKDEGVAAVVLTAIVFPCLAVRIRGWKSIVPACLLVVPALLLGALWLIERRALIPDPSNIMASSGIKWGRLPEALRSLGSQFVRFKEWSLLWPAVALGLILRPPKPGQADSLLAYVTLALLGVYVLSWIAYPTDNMTDLIIRHTVNRLVMHVMPALFVAGLSRLFPAPEQPRAGLPDPAAVS